KSRHTEFQSALATHPNPKRHARKNEIVCQRASAEPVELHFPAHSGLGLSAVQFEGNGEGMPARQLPCAKMTNMETRTTMKQAARMVAAPSQCRTHRAEFQQRVEKKRQFGPCWSDAFFVQGRQILTEIRMPTLLPPVLWQRRKRGSTIECLRG